MFRLISGTDEESPDRRVGFFKTGHSGSSLLTRSDAWRIEGETTPAAQLLLGASLLPRDPIAMRLTLPRTDPDFLRYIGRLIDSYRRWTGRDLLPGPAIDRGDRLYLAPFAIIAHGTEEDPIFNFGNQVALELWEMTWESFTRMPSRLTTEAAGREERAAFLAQVTRQGFVERYRGVRISSTGLRFLIEDATVWNIIDPMRGEGGPDPCLGQAAAFRKWTYL